MSPERTYVPADGVPPDLPVEALARISTRIRGVGVNRQHARLALSPVSYRFMAVTELDVSLARQLQTSFGSLQAYEEERDLFNFFVNADSVFESFAYMAFAIAGCRNRQAFPFATPRDRMSVSIYSTIAAFRQTYPNDRLTTALVKLGASPTRRRVRSMRNRLAHRATAPRTYHVGRGRDGLVVWRMSVHDLQDVPLVPAYIHGIRMLVAARLCRLADAADAFTAERLSVVR